jgi:hypothetical protein
MRRGFGTRRTWRKLKAATSLWLLVLATFSLLLAGNTVWATPPQNRLHQTIPTLTPTPMPSWEWIGGPAGSALDYAPSGMPDLDQRQVDWQGTVGGNPWTHCGPVAVADALWWLDSILESGSIAPPQQDDSHALVTAFGDWDDHDAQNVIPLVGDLASRLNTKTGATQPGTRIANVVPALETYIAEKQLQDAHKATLIAAPTFNRLLSWVQQDDGVVLLLGFWEWQGDRWVYLGGHYVAVAGAEPMNRYLAISDPFRDAWEAGLSALGRSPMSHSYPHASNVHNDARDASHDAFRTITTEGPGGAIALEGYVPAFAGVPNFIGQNVPSELEGYLGQYSGSPVITAKIDYAVRISRRVFAYALHLPLILKVAR